MSILQQRLAALISIRYVLLFHSLLLSSLLSAQQPYSLIHYDEDVLPQTSIGNIQQDKDGYLWMSTQFGIVRFDGETFRVFTTKNLKGLSSNRIRLCAKDYDKNICFVDENGLLITVKSPNSFELVRYTDVVKKHKPVYTTENNNDLALLKLNANRNFSQLNILLQQDTTKELLKSFSVGKNRGYVFYIDLQQKIRVCYYDGDEYLTKVVDDSFIADHSFSLNQTVFTQTGTTDALQFSTVNVVRKVPVNGLPAAFEPAFKAETHVVFSGESGVFFYSAGKLYQYELRDSSIEATLVFENLPCTGVVNVMRERTTGDLLISTKSDGFYRIKKKQFEALNLVTSNNLSHNANNNIIYGLALWDAKHLFSTTGLITPIAGHGLSTDFDSTNKAIMNLHFVYPKDRDHLWLNMNAGSKSVIQSFDKRTGTYKPLMEIIQPRKVIEFASGRTLLVGANKLMSVQNEKVSEVLASETLEFTTAEKVTEECIALGTSTGMYYFYPDQKKLIPVAYKEPLRVRFIMRDRSGKFWFTTYGQGLFHISGNTIVSIPPDNAGYLSISHNISEDRNGNFWISTNNGLFKIGYTSLLDIVAKKSDKLYYAYFDKTDGFNTNEFNGGCFPSGLFQPETGLMFLPSMNGIIKFNPDSIRNVNISSAIFFDQIDVNDTGRIYQVSGTPVFTSKTSSIPIHISSPYYGHTENVKFSYALSNDPEHWIELSGNRTIALNNIPGGDYSLTVKKHDGSGAPVLASLHFTIEKKFRETYLFWILLLVLVTALVYLFFQARLNYLQKERKRLEKEVATRTADQLSLIGQLRDNIKQLQKLQLELGQMIEHKENVIAVLIHDIKSPLYFLSTVAAHLDKGIENNPVEKNKKISSEISVSLNRLYIFTQDFATWLDVSRPGYIQNPQSINLARIVEDVIGMYQGIIEKKSLVIVNHLRQEHVYGDEPMMKSVVRNLLDNAIKNMSSGKVTIESRFLSEGSRCEVVITDEGKGMTEQDLMDLNNYFKLQDKSRAFPNAGFGHRVIRDFLNQLAGEISYQPNFPTGIIVVLRLPTMQEN